MCLVFASDALVGVCEPYLTYLPRWCVPVMIVPILDSLIRSAYRTASTGMARSFVRAQSYLFVIACPLDTSLQRSCLPGRQAGTLMPVREVVSGDLYGLLEWSGC